MQKHSYVLLIITYRELIKRNADNNDNYMLLMKAYKLDPSKDSYDAAEMEIIVKILEGIYAIDSN